MQQSGVILIERLFKLERVVGSGNRDLIGLQSLIQLAPSVMQISSISQRARNIRMARALRLGPQVIHPAVKRFSGIEKAIRLKHSRKIIQDHSPGLGRLQGFFKKFLRLYRPACIIGIAGGLHQRAPLLSGEDRVSETGRHKQHGRLDTKKGGVMFAEAIMAVLANSGDGPGFHIHHRMG